MLHIKRRNRPKLKKNDLVILLVILVWSLIMGCLLTFAANSYADVPESEVGKPLRCGETSWGCRFPSPKLANPEGGSLRCSKWRTVDVVPVEQQLGKNFI